MRKFFWLCLVTLAGISISRAQQAPGAGEVSGLVQDPAREYALPSATVAVYRMADSSLLGFQLTVGNGTFRLAKLPAGVPLKLVVSYMGYAPLVRRFTIDPQKPVLALGALDMQRTANTLGEVVVAAPPVRMKGDTLEFNADAFRLDSASVLEDLMRKLPGVTVWGDGVITVNGRQVQSVLVDGKPFFGSQGQVALQNLPKVGVEKVQVYNKADLKADSRDSVLEMNVKLKKGYKRGLFGKLSAGAGTSSRFQANGMVSVYTPKTQISLLGAANNINIVPADPEAMLANASFKAGALQISYPNFRMAGANQPNAGGLTWLHDFREATSIRKDRLEGNYFVRNDNSQLVRQRNSVTSLPGNDQLLRENLRRSNYATRQQLTSKYEWQRGKSTGYVSGTGNHTNASWRYDQATHVETGTGAPLSQNLRGGGETERNTGAQVQIGLSARPKPGRVQKGNHPNAWDGDYTFSAHRRQFTGRNKTAFTAFGTGGDDAFFNRNFSSRENGTQHRLKIEGANFSRWLFGPRFLYGVQTRFRNQLDVEHKDHRHLVNDLDAAGVHVKTNGYLSYTSTEKFIQETPSLTFSRLFDKSLTDRYSKQLTIDVTAKAQFTAQDNRSSHAFLDVTRRYGAFLPEASLRYRNQQSGMGVVTHWLQYAETLYYPAVQDLARVTDSADAYMLYFGNPQLRESRQRALTYRLTGYLFDMNDLNYGASLTAASVARQQSDSVWWDAQGRRMRYAVNVDGHRFLNATANLDKAFKLGKHQLQLRTLANGRIAREPGYVNGQLNVARVMQAGGNVDLIYTYRDRLLLGIEQSANIRRSRQEVPAQRVLRSFYAVTTANAGWKIGGRWSVTSNLAWNYAKMSTADGEHFAIWNAGTACRLLKGKNIEIAVSAMDLLRQNVSIVNNGHDNTISQTRSNVLEQYFMCTLSWFPRRFGPAGK